jgi:putative SOS response-associated peptidase YedK
MCGRIIQASGPLRYAFVDGLDVRDTRLSNLPRRYNGAPSQAILVIRENHKTGERSLDPVAWGFVPNWQRDPKPKQRPINAKSETVARSGLFGEAFAHRRCIIPVDGFFEWRATKQGRQPYAIGMKDGSPFGLAGIWDNWKDPATGEWTRTFAIITVPANALVAGIHDRMPAILRPEDYERWLSPEPDARDLLRPFPAEAMRMWPVSMRVNTPQNDDASLIDPVTLDAELATA